MRFAITENGAVVNVAEGESPLADNWHASDTANIGDLFDGNVFTRPAPVLSRSEMASQIDAAVAAIYAKPSAFVKEYEAREAQARAFKAAGYTGTVPPRVQGFATPAGLTAQAATDLIISQADQLLAALDLLSDLRMQKYAVTGAATDADARTAFDSTMASIAAIAASLG